MVDLMIFVDGSNIFRSMGRYQAGYRVDYAKLIEILKKDDNLIRVYYYASSNVPPIEAQTCFYDKLELDLNFRMIIKPLKGKAGNKREKGVDVALVTDFLSLGYKNAYKKAIIVSGDQDYASAIKNVQDLGIRVVVAGFKHSMGKELKRISDNKIYLDDIADDIKK
jgi:uncharacterized LabA/DUF88 family protein